jgi:type VI secretion system protein ImpG
MDPRLLRYYNAELQHFREMSGEFAKEYPKIAGRLGLDSFECADPYVERLIEGFAFLAARVQLKVDARFPRFTQHLLDLVYPHYLQPTPSMAVVRFQPTLSEGGLADGFPIPRGTALRSLLGKGDQTPCEYRTAHDVSLWPIELVEAEYLASPGAVATLGVGEVQGAPAAIRLRLRTTAGLTFDKLALDRLTLYLGDTSEKAMRLYEALLAHAEAMVLRPTSRPVPWQEIVRVAPVRPVGFEPDQALLPYGGQSFDGYRLLHEYFACPSRFMFVDLVGLGKAVRRLADNELDILILLKRADPRLDRAVDPNDFSLFCTPAINLFPKVADRIHLTEQTNEHHVVVDRTRPMDFEVYRVRSVAGLAAGNEAPQEFRPFFGATDLADAGTGRAYYAVHREQRLLSSRQRSRGPRSSYIGSEVFVSLVDANEAPYRHDLKQLAVEVLCTNRDLPIDMPVGKGTTDFTMQLGAPVEAIRCLAGPTWPRPSYAEGDTTWNLISHLSLNYLTLIDKNPEEGAAAFRELLSLYADLADPSVRKQVEGVRSIASRPVVRRAIHPGPIAFVRGLEITLTIAEEAFEGSGGFLLAAVLDRFLAKYVTINSFTETVLRTITRGEIVRWQKRPGQRHLV